MTNTNGKEPVNFDVKAKKTTLISPEEGFKITFNKGGNLIIDIDSPQGAIKMEKVLRLAVKRAEADITFSKGALEQMKDAIKKLEEIKTQE